MMTTQGPIKDFFVALWVVAKGLFAVGSILFFIGPVVAIPLAVVIWVLQIPFIGVQ